MKTKRKKKIKSYESYDAGYNEGYKKAVTEIYNKFEIYNKLEKIRFAWHCNCINCEDFRKKLKEMKNGQ